MTDDKRGMPWLPAMFAEQMQDASEQAIESQADLFEQFSSPMPTEGPFSGLTGLADTAMFKTRVQSGGRISIPDAEREALDIEEGDIVQAVVFPVKRSRSDSDQ
jgi:hypothetical protein